MLKYLSHITIIREIVMKRTTKNLICAASLIAIASIAACGPKTSQEMEAAEVTEPVTAAVDESWKNGRNLTGYDVSDKNGARTLWVEFGEESADIYDDKGQIFGSVNYGQLKDTEYSKQGFALLILIMTDTLMHQCRESRMNSVIIHITGYTILLTESSWTEPQSLPMRKKCFGL